MSPVGAAQHAAEAPLTGSRALQLPAPLSFRSVILLLGPTLRQFRGTAGPLSTLLLAFTAFVFAAAFSLALLAFLIMHLRLIARNQTTIEAFEKAPVK